MNSSARTVRFDGSSRGSERALKSLYDPEKPKWLAIADSSGDRHGRKVAACSLRSGVAANKRCLACLLTMKSVQPPTPEAGTMEPGAAEKAAASFFTSESRPNCESTSIENEITVDIVH